MQSRHLPDEAGRVPGSSGDPTELKTPVPGIRCSNSVRGQRFGDTPSLDSSYVTSFDFPGRLRARALRMLVATTPPPSSSSGIHHTKSHSRGAAASGPDLMRSARKTASPAVAAHETDSSANPRARLADRPLGAVTEASWQPSPKPPRTRSRSPEPRRRRRSLSPGQPWRILSGLRLRLQHSTAGGDQARSNECHSVDGPCNASHGTKAESNGHHSPVDAVLPVS